MALQEVLSSRLASGTGDVFTLIKISIINFLITILQTCHQYCNIATIIIWGERLVPIRLRLYAMHFDRTWLLRNRKLS